ncbi:helix-turn-helix domain-containing protein [Variovorax gossypii]
MPNIASILKTEISRVARKEVRAELESLKKTSTQQRGAIAELRRQVAALQQQLRAMSKGAQSASKAKSAASSGASEASVARRFSASRLAAHRAKLGLSAASYGQLLGLSGQTIYNWEQGQARPGPAHLEALVAVRGLSAREIAEQLGTK